MKLFRFIAVACFGVLFVAAFYTHAQQPNKKAAGKELDADLAQLVQGNNEFAFDLYRQLSKKEGNIVFSPYSISTALAMTYAGARGETAREMAKAMRFTLPQERLHAAFADGIRDLHGNDIPRPYHLNVANGVWPARGLGLVEDFSKLMREQYRAGIREMDFGSQPDQARKIINHWVEEQTKEKIKEILEKGNIGSQTKLVLTNAIYFKGTWETPFGKENTKIAAFETSSGKKIMVPTMHHRKARFRYFGGPEFEMLELPYLGHRIDMVVVLPRKRGGLAELEKNLTATRFKEGLDKLSFHRGEAALPRFKALWRASLVPDLGELGMRLAFGAADFSGIGSVGAITDVIHKAYIDVDEVGTEAAAATAVILGVSGFASFTFQADHPFLFFIRDGTTGGILFMGRLTDPRGLN